MDKRFVVQYQDGSFMVLRGPFEYQYSTKDVEGATLMFRSKAHAYAEMWKGHVIQVG